MALFFNNPTKTYTPMDVAKIQKVKPNTVRVALHRFWKNGLLRRLGKHKYILADPSKALTYLDGGRSIYLGYTASLDEELPFQMIPHHERIPIKITNEMFSRLEYRFSKPGENDRAMNRTFESKSFTLTISQNTLSGVIYLKGIQWRAELMKYFGDELLKQCDRNQKSIGISLDADHWANFRLAQKDLQLTFASSHFWKELDIEGKQKYVDSLLQNICKTGFVKTTYEAEISKLLLHVNERLDNIEGLNEQYVKIIQDLTEKIELKNVEDKKVFT